MEQQLPSDLASFVHILSPDGAIVAQYDGLDAAPDTLHPGDAFIQLHLLPLPDPPPQGKHALQIGLYTRGNGQRLMLPGELADRLILAADLRLDGE
ncbi:MAG: hypothetical protein GY803_21910 [Chloroflexi bacterium]|nr:hypothetical protein [Chloroflexota bacterium]